MNQTETLVFKNLQSRERNNQQTDLTNMYRAIYKTNPDIDQIEFLNVFKKLQEHHAGVLVIGRGGNPNRFIWKYNLKEVADQALKNHTDFTKLQVFSARTRKDRYTLKRALPVAAIDKMLKGRAANAFTDVTVATPIIKIRKNPKNLLAAKPKAESKPVEAVPEVMAATSQDVIESKPGIVGKVRRKRRTKRAMKAHALKAKRVANLTSETKNQFKQGVPVLRIEIGSNARKEDVEAFMQLARELAGTK